MASVEAKSQLFLNALMDFIECLQYVTINQYEIPGLALTIFTFLKHSDNYTVFRVHKYSPIFAEVFFLPSKLGYRTIKFICSIK